MRDGLSLLDQCASATTGELTADKVYSCLGIAGIQQCGELMAHIADHNTGEALSLLNRFYAEGKDMGALLDELACLARDFMVMQSAPKEAIGMLSGVATDEEVKKLSARFTSAELVRMLDLIQKTTAGFVRSASRRMDAELCIVNLCQPELQLDAESLNTRLTRLEDRINSGSVAVTPVSVPQTLQEAPPAPVVEEFSTEIPSCEAVDEAPAGFWTEMCMQIRKELKPPVSGFFAPNGPVQGVLQGNTLVLSCANKFAKEVVDKPEVLELVNRKVSAKLGHPVRVLVSDKTNVNNKQMEQLLQFGRDHSNVVNIKD